VKVAPDKEDGRARRLILTDAGRRLLAKAVPIWVEEHGKLDRELAAYAPESLRKGLKAISR